MDQSYIINPTRYFQTLPENTLSGMYGLDYAHVWLIKTNITKTKQFCEHFGLFMDQLVKLQVN